MADSSYEKGLTELAKMKVADLRVELKQRGLPITGNKTELVERLQLAIQEDKSILDTSLSLDETNEEILDEDAVLEDEEIEDNDNEHEQENENENENEVLATKPESKEVAEKRKLSTEENNTTAKKIILNRKNILEEIKTEQDELIEKNGKTSESEPQKKIIKLTELNKNERLEMRAKKFDVPLSEVAKKEVRASRFNISSNTATTTTNNSTTNNSKSAASIKNAQVHTTYDVLKKRAERFGSNVSTLLEKAELEDKIEKRKARFGEVKAIDKVVPTKIKLVK